MVWAEAARASLSRRALSIVFLRRYCQREKRRRPRKIVPINKRGFKERCQSAINSRKAFYLVLIKFFPHPAHFMVVKGLFDIEVQGSLLARFDNVIKGLDHLLIL
jgi:hypothetical protein